MILDVLTRLVADIFDMDPEDISEDCEFIEDLNADEMDLVELVFACEEEFDVSLSEISEADEDLFAGKLKTVGDLARYLEARVEE